MESLVSPIKKQERRYSDSDAKNNEENSAVLLNSDNSLYCWYRCFLDRWDSKYSDSTDEESDITIGRKGELVLDDSMDEDSMQKVVIPLTQDVKPPFCYFCHGTEDLIKCTGGCGRSYHLRCIGMKMGKIETWKCRQCRGQALKSSNFHKKHCLREWYIRNAGVNVTGSVSLIIEGSNTLDNTVWRCSTVDHLLDATHFVTASGSIYCLIVGIDCKSKRVGSDE